MEITPRLTRWITDHCGADAERVLGLLAGLRPELYGGQDPERIHAAFVLETDGTWAAVWEMHKLANLDWRDLLMAGGLGFEGWEHRLDEILGPHLPADSEATGATKPAPAVRADRRPADPAPRPLSDAERGVLDRLLAEDFPGAPELRVQARTALAQRTCRCGCASIDLDVDPSAPLADVTERVPVSATAELPEPIGPVAVLLFVGEGRLSLLEIAGYGDRVPDHWPAAESLVIDGV